MNIMYKVKQSDLIREIKNFPIEVVQKMIEEQLSQGNAPDVTVFQNNSNANVEYDGFSWDETEDGSVFWDKVINEHDFDLFFKKYPKDPMFNYLLPGRVVRTNFNLYGLVLNSEANPKNLRIITENQEGIVIEDIECIYESLATTTKDLFNPDYLKLIYQKGKIVISKKDLAKKYNIEVDNLIII